MVRPAWIGDRSESPTFDVAHITAALLKPPGTNISHSYRRSISTSRGKEKRNEYQKQRSRADRAELKRLKTEQPELYAQLLAEVRGESNA